MDLLAAVFAPSALSLLDAVAISSGASCIDVGCGGGHVAIELGRRVGPAGHVVGIDLDTDLLEVARTEAAARDSTMSASASPQSRTWRSPASTSPVPACSSCTCPTRAGSPGRW